MTLTNTDNQYYAAGDLMTFKEFNNAVNNMVQDEIDLTYPSPDDFAKGLICATIVYLPVVILFVCNHTSVLSILAWGAICCMIGARMTFYYANKRVSERQNKRQATTL